MPSILDTLDVIKNLEGIYESDRAFRVLKDFERVIDELGLYVYANWENGELVDGPRTDRHWITCTFMWKEADMPDPMGGKRLLDYDCKIKYKKSSILVARQIKTPTDFRPGTKKGKLDREPIWLVEIQMPKKLIVDIYGGSLETYELEDKKGAAPVAPAQAAAPMAPPAGAAPAIATPTEAPVGAAI
jgi:hypothetical protein